MGAARKKTARSSGAGLSGLTRKLGPVLRSLYRPVTLATAGLVLLAGLLLPRLIPSLPDLSSRQEYQLPARNIEVTQPPHWVPRQLVERVVENANLPETLSLLDETLVQQVAEAFRINPWVEDVVEVRKSFPPRIVVELRYRLPVAMVEVKQWHYPVDRHGVLLPAEDFSVSDSRLYPVIQGVSSTPQGPAGTNWGDRLVDDAASLAADLAPLWKKLGLSSIVCPEEEADSAGGAARFDERVFVLLSRGGSRIVWGHAPGTDHPGELSTEQKLGRLEDYVKRFGSFDEPHGPYRIDIRHRRDITRTPLSARHRWWR